MLTIESSEPSTFQAFQRPYIRESRGTRELPNQTRCLRCELVVSSNTAIECKVLVGNCTGELRSIADHCSEQTAEGREETGLEGDEFQYRD